MTWMDLFLLLEGMKNINHTSLCDTPAQRVTINMGEQEYFIDLVESMTTGKLMLVLPMEENDVD
jgi:hypothetical protein